MTHSKNDRKLQPGARPAPIDPDLSKRLAKELAEAGENLPEDARWALAFIPLGVKLRNARAQGDGVTLTAEETTLLCRVIGAMSAAVRDRSKP